MAEMTTPEIRADEFCVHTSRSDITFICYFPEENDPNDVRDITTALSHIGIFDGLNLET